MACFGAVPGEVDPLSLLRRPVAGAVNGRVVEPEDLSVIGSDPAVALVIVEPPDGPRTANADKLWAANVEGWIALAHSDQQRIPGALVVAQGSSPGLRRFASMVRAVFFDLDGTLIDHVGAQRAALTAQLHVSHPGLSQAQVDDAGSLWSELESQHFGDYLAGRVSFAEQRRRRVAGLLGAIGDTDASDGRDKWFEGYRSRYERAWKAYDDVQSALDGLLGVQPEVLLGVLTNGEAAQQRAKLVAADIASYFSTVLTSSELGIAKPDARAFVAACNAVGQPPHAVAYVGDNLEADARAATAAGLRGIWLDRTDSGDAPHSPTITSLAFLAHELRSRT